MSALGAEDEGLEQALSAFGIKIIYHPALTLHSGEEAQQLLKSCLDGSVPLDILCVEGSILGEGFHTYSGDGKPFRDLIRDMAGVARHVVAIGSCATFGGIPAAGPNPSEADGLQFTEHMPGGLLGEEFRSRSGMPVINLSGCAPHPGWIVETLVALKLGSFSQDDVDGFARPRFFADHLAHHGCSRNEYYEFKASAESFAQAGCMMEHLGCKATQAAGDCNQRTWSGGRGCTGAGFTCIACTQPGFEQPGHSFQTTPKVAGIPLGLPRDMPKAWFIALAALSKSATPERVKANATRQHTLIPPWPRRGKSGGRP